MHVYDKITGRLKGMVNISGYDNKITKIFFKSLKKDQIANLFYGYKVSQTKNSPTEDVIFALSGGKIRIMHEMMFE